MEENCFDPLKDYWHMRLKRARARRRELERRRRRGELVERREVEQLFLTRIMAGLT